jgi:hypothetical protein
MKESHGKGPASHSDPESCADGRKAGGGSDGESWWTGTGRSAGRGMPSCVELLEPLNDLALLRLREDAFDGFHLNQGHACLLNERWTPAVRERYSLSRARPKRRQGQGRPCRQRWGKNSPEVSSHPGSLLSAPESPRGPPPRRHLFAAPAAQHAPGKRGTAPGIEGKPLKGP